MLRTIATLVFACAVLATVARAADNTPTPSASRPPRLSDLFGDEVLARGKGVEVKRSQLEEAFVAFRANLASSGRPIPEGQRTTQESQLLQRLVVTQILTNRVTEADLTVAKGMEEKFMAEARKNAVSEDAFQRQLKAMGLSPEQFQRRVREQALSEAVIQREVTSGIKISEEQIREFYNTGTDVLVRLMQAELEKMVKDPAAAPATIAQFKQRIDDIRKANLARLEQQERVRISHVYMATIDRKTEEPLPEEQRKFKRAQMEKIRKLALGGEDFAKLVQEFSEDRGLKQTKGEYTFSRDDAFSAEFKSAAFSLSPGQVSDVITTPIGLHVIKLIERTPAKKTEFEKVSDELKDFLTQQELQRAMPDYFGRLIKDASVEILDPKYKELTVAEPKQP
jgi:peptidyl-prolyl cis-trans isomerase SurA